MEDLLNPTYISSKVEAESGDSETLDVWDITYTPGAILKKKILLAVERWAFSNILVG